MKKNIRRMTTLLLALLLLASMPLNALAASYDVGDFAGLSDAFNDNSGEDVVINVTADIDFGGYSVSAKENTKYTIGTGNGSILKNANVGGAGSVEINMNLGGENGLTAFDDVSVTVNGNIIADHDGVNSDGNSNVTVKGNIESHDKGVYSHDNSTVTVEGSIKSLTDEGVYATDDATVTVKGDILADDTAIYAKNDAVVNVTGDVEGDDLGILATGNASVAVDGNVAGMDGDPDDVNYNDPGDYSDGGDGICAADSATVKVTGNVSGGDSYGTFGYGGDAMEVYDSANVTVGGDVTGGSVTANPDTGANLTEESCAGRGISMKSTATVSVGGNVSGGSTNGDAGYGGDGVYITVVDSKTAGSLTAEGAVTGGKAPANGVAGSSISIDSGFSTDLAEQTLPGIAVGSYDNLSGIGYTDEELKAIAERIRTVSAGDVAQVEDMFWRNVLKQIRGAKEGDTITVDAGSRTVMPAYIMDAVREYKVILVIQWNGGDDIVIEKAYEGDETYTVFKLAELTDLLKG